MNDVLRRLKAELDEITALRDNLKATQERCSELLEDSRQKGRRIKVLEAELEALRQAWLDKHEGEKPARPKRKVYEPVPISTAEAEDLLYGPTLANFAQEHGVKATDVLIYLLGKGVQGIHINSRIEREHLQDLLRQFPKKGSKVEEMPIAKSSPAMSESLPRNAVESPHKQPPFRPIDPEPRDMVIDGGGARWRDRMRVD